MRVGIALGQRRNGERGERAGAVERVVLVLRGAGIVEPEVGERRRRMARDAVADGAGRRAAPGRPAGVAGRGRLGEEDLETGELALAERERLRVQDEAAVAGADESELGISTDELAQAAAVGSGGSPGSGARGKPFFARKTSYGDPLNSPAASWANTSDST